MNKTTKQEEELFVEEEGSWVEGDYPKIDQGAVTIDKEKASVEEERFSDEEKDWVDGDQPKIDSMSQSVTEKILEIRSRLSDDSKTAQAIDREASWIEISQLAEEEEVHSISSLIFEAEQQGLEEQCFVQYRFLYQHKLSIPVSLGAKR